MWQRKEHKKPFGIDFGVGDIIVPKQEKRKIPTQLDDFEAPTVNTYSLETTVAEKLDDNYILVPLNTKLSTIAATLVGIENRRIQLCYAIPEIYNVNNYAMPGDNATIVDLFEFQEFK